MSGRPATARASLFLAASLLVAPPFASGLAAQTVQLRGQRGPARAAAARRVLDAAPAGGPIAIDGRLDEVAWGGAQVAGDFQQREPREGAPASERSEVRVLFDQDALYVGAWLHDAHPDSIVGQLARRDAPTTSDGFYVTIDSYHDRRTGFGFALNPRNVQRDFVVYNGAETDDSWDAVWSSATRVDTAGWYAEVRIPLSQLRFSAGDTSAGGVGVRADLRWGINFTRWIARRREDTHWSLVPRDAPAWAAHWGELRGLRLTSAPRRLEVVPYTVGRLTRDAPAAGDPFHRLNDPFGTAGADVRVGLTPNVTLTAAINPDFGQVEADPAVVNLGAYEIFLPERRPFFVEGIDIFRFSTSEWWDYGELFYSRRIGRAPQGELPDTVRFDDVPTAARLLAAGKLSGKTAGGWSLGALTAVTAAERGRWVDTAGAFHEETIEPQTAYGVARVARDFRAGQSTVGAIATVTRRGDHADEAVATLRDAAYTGGVDVRHLFAGGKYQLAGWLLGSRVVGSPAAIRATQRSSTHYFQRPDAPHLDYDTTRTALDGAAAFAAVRKNTGDWRFQLTGRAFSPGFEANDLGYQPQADAAIQYAAVGRVWTRPGRAFRDGFVWLNQWARWNFGGELLGTRQALNVGGQLHNGWQLFLGLDRGQSGLAVDGTRGGPALRYSAWSNVSTTVSTDPRRAVALTLNAWSGRSGEGGRWTSVRPGVVVRPASQVDVLVEPSFTANRFAMQYVDRATAHGETRYVIGQLRQRTAALTARVNYAATPTLSLQLYAQPFLSAGRYTGFREVVAPRARRYEDRFRRYAPSQLWAAPGDELAFDRDGDGAADFTLENPDFDTKQFRSNAVLRWEYRPGSALFVVWSQDRAVEEQDGRLDVAADARRLFREPGRNVLLVKASYWLSL
ncbi:MAG TPA: DUF5916 domain-containing protein [Gemmatimonadaceae bacterium]|nr:DUF5916 domain-containing protein [Gemmatimonadaceae bacterium]